MGRVRFGRRAGAQRGPRPVGALRGEPRVERLERARQAGERPAVLAHRHGERRRFARGENAVVVGGARADGGDVRRQRRQRDVHPRRRAARVGDAERRRRGGVAGRREVESERRAGDERTMEVADRGVGAERLGAAAHPDSRRHRRSRDGVGREAAHAGQRALEVREQRLAVVAPVLVERRGRRHLGVRELDRRRHLAAVVVEPVLHPAGDRVPCGAVRHPLVELRAREHRPVVHGVVVGERDERVVVGGGAVDRRAGGVVVVGVVVDQRAAVEIRGERSRAAGLPVHQVGRLGRPVGRDVARVVVRIGEGAVEVDAGGVPALAERRAVGIDERHDPRLDVLDDVPRARVARVSLGEPVRETDQHLHPDQLVAVDRGEVADDGAVAAGIGRQADPHPPHPPPLRRRAGRRETHDVRVRGGERLQVGGQRVVGVVGRRGGIRRRRRRGAGAETGLGPREAERLELVLLRRGHVGDRLAPAVPLDVEPQPDEPREGGVVERAEIDDAAFGRSGDGNGGARGKRGASDERGEREEGGAESPVHGSTA